MTTDTEALRAPQPAAQQGDARVTLPDDIERMAVNRYRPVPAGVLAYKVVGGDGDRSLFSGTKDECQIVARKLTEAFLDGAHVALAAKAETAAAGEPVAFAHFAENGNIRLWAPERPRDLDGNVAQPLFTADQLAAAVAAERERAAMVCERIADDYNRREGLKYPELKTDAETGANECADAIRAGAKETSNG